MLDYASGIGTQGVTRRLMLIISDVGTTNPQGPEGTLQVGTGITFCNTGIISAIGGKFSGDFTVGGTLTYEDVQNVNSSGIVTAQSGVRIVGGGLTVTGVSTSSVMQKFPVIVIRFCWVQKKRCRCSMMEQTV